MTTQVAVPLEPTDEQIMAALRAIATTTGSVAQVVAAYKAMIEARPDRNPGE